MQPIGYLQPTSPFIVYDRSKSIDFSVAEWSQVRMERENNLKEYRTESDELPKYGAGSEYGRELKVRK